MSESVRFKKSSSRFGITIKESDAVNYIYRDCQNGKGNGIAFATQFTFYFSPSFH